MHNHARYLILLAILMAPRAWGVTPVYIEDCKRRYKDTYRTYSLNREEWDSKCEEGMVPADIRIIAQEICKAKYDPDEGKNIGLTREMWERDYCDQAQKEFVSPEQYLRAQRIRGFLSKPDNKITVADVFDFMFDTSDSKDPKILIQRARWHIRLKQAEAARQRFSHSLAESDLRALPVEMGQAKTSEEFHRKAAHFFDNAGLTPSRLSPIFLASKRPAPRLAAPTRPDPFQVKTRLLAQISSLNTLKDEKGRRTYDPLIIAMMRELVDSVPINSGLLPHTDFIALSDVQDTIETIILNHTIIVLNRKSKSYATTFTESDKPEKALPRPAIKNADGTWRYQVSIKPGEPCTTSRYPLEFLAGVLLHEVGGHVHLNAQGGGKNNYTDEIHAHQMEARYFSNKRQRFNEQIKRLTQNLDHSPSPLTWVDRKHLTKTIAALTRLRDHFMPETEMLGLETFQSSPAEFREEMIRDYYGTDPKEDEIFPGQVTILQQKKWALDIKSAAVLKELATDEDFEAETRQRDQEWRTAKKEECRSLLINDPVVNDLRKKINIIVIRTHEPGLSESQKNALNRRGAQLNLAYNKLMESYDACRIR